MSKKVVLSKNDICKIAHLARLNIEENDIPQYTTELSNTLDLIANMNRVDTEAVAPMAHPFQHIQRFREDKTTEHNEREKFQKLAPEVEAGLYLVPQVIE